MRVGRDGSGGTWPRSGSSPWDWRVPNCKCRLPQLSQDPVGGATSWLPAPDSPFLEGGVCLAPQVSLGLLSGGKGVRFPYEDSPPLRGSERQRLEIDPQVSPDRWPWGGPSLHEPGGPSSTPLGVVAPGGRMTHTSHLGEKQCRPSGMSFLPSILRRCGQLQVWRNRRNVSARWLSLRWEGD